MKSVIPIFTIILVVAFAKPVLAQKRSRENNQSENHQQATKGNHPTRQVATRPTVNRQPTTQPNINRQPATRPTVNRPPYNNSLARRPSNRQVYRPQGWAVTRRPYTRPPVVYGGKRFYTYHRYYSHPFTAFSYGPRWHPIGFFISSMISTAIVIDIASRSYRYSEGVFYAPYNNGYQVVPAPPGAYVTSIPDGFQQLAVGDQTYYYFGGAFFVRNGNNYEVVPAPAGGVVYNLPQGSSVVQVDSYNYVLYNDTYYQPIQINGQNAYEVVELEQ